MFPYQVSLDRAQSALAQSGQLFKILFEHGSLSVEFYKPDQIDRQTPHTRDEVYIVAAGSGIFEVEGARTPFEVGDFLFVPAGLQHRFLDFSEDFSTWVIFYGPAGGEKGALQNLSL
jgi:mannose-6-phosphate isomerase-like protein (cupin superfamily)